MGYKIAWFTEGGWEGKVPRNHPNMRNDMAWMHTLNVTHYPIQTIHQIDEKYDVGIITIPKTNIDKISQYSLIESMRKICKKIGTMQEGPHWYFQDYSMEQQIWFYNTLMELDFIWCHNEIDKKYYEGLTNKKCYVNPTLMLEETGNGIPITVEKDSVIIGGNMCRWYGGFDSYIVANEFGSAIYAPSMGRKIELEDQMENLTHLQYMTWVDWIVTLKQFKYGVHLMPTWAAGTFTLNCAYHGIPCIGYKGLDTQEQLHPSLSVDYGDLNEAKILAKRLRDDNEFYKKCSDECKSFYGKSSFREDKYIDVINSTLKKVMGDN